MGQLDLSNNLIELKPLVRANLVQRATQPEIYFSPRKHLRNRHFCIVTDHKDKREPILERGIPTPNIQPKPGTAAISNYKSSAHGKVLLEFMQAFPELGTALSRACKNDLRPKIFSSE
jgi:hypothetical protein